MSRERIKDKSKTKAQLADELKRLREKAARLNSLKAEHKEIQRVLKETEEKYRNLVERANDGIAIVQEKIFKYVNPKLAEMGGYAVEELIGTPFTDYIYPEELPRVLYRYRRRMAGEKVPSIYESAIISKRKQKIPVEFNASITLYQGKPADFVIVRDISDRKRAEEELQWERDMAQKYLDIAGVIIVALNKRGEVTLISKKGCEILGWNEREIIGKNWFENFLPEEMKEKVREIFEKLIAGETEIVEYFNNPVLTEGGEKRFIAWYNTVMTNESGETIGILSSGEDITEHKRAEEALRESEERYKTLVKTSPDAVTVADLDGKITYVSQRTLELHGFKNEAQLLGKSVLELFAPEDKAKAMLNLKKTLKEGTTRNVEYNMLKKDGSRFIGEINSSVIKDKDSNPRLFIATTRDATERKRAEQKLRTSIREKEVLLQEIHHRVKNNLQIISSILDMSSLRIRDAQANDLITDARSIIQTMAFIHSQLYRSERFDRIEMGTHIRELVSYLSALYVREKKISTYVDISEVYLSMTQAIPCALVLNELISNAFKHAFKGKQKGTIEVSMQIHAGQRVFMKVKDNSVGICGEIDIYETDSLGLKLVRNLVEKQLKGKIQVSCDRGTEFSVDFQIN